MSTKSPSQIEPDPQLRALFQYQYHLASTDQTLFLLHGTGGSESDLLSLVTPFRATHNIVGLLGNVREQGMARFFARYADGTFDRHSIDSEVKKLHQFVMRWLEIHRETCEQHSIHFVGYSNGANMILAYLFLYPQMVKTAALLHPMLPFKPDEHLQLSQKKLFVSWGSADPMVPTNMSQNLLQVLKKHGAQLTIHQSVNHSIDTLEIRALERFLQSTGE